MKLNSHFQLINFLKTFFHNHGCHINHLSKNTIKIKLTKKLDLFMMNRPFYWHYMDQMGKVGETMSLTLTTDPNNQQPNVEFVHFGSPRYTQIINYLQKHETLIKLYESVYTNTSTPLFPWLLTNIKITYKGNQVREELFSVGINLINGQMKTNVMESLESYSLEQTISDYCHCLTPLITLNNGYLRIEDVILNYLKEQDISWSNLAIESMKEEIAMLEYFFKQTRNDPQYEIEKDKIHDRFSPTISLDVVSAGILYLTESFHKKAE